ncbi:hypothetical protein [Rothia halotolerans]|uniref:hypothetical protein n=1 Tax=Rothia halotolerans TaxID=405770 RepID=UPI00101D06A4|nr:hypothetical protein [Rothia halotolerans]
MADIPRSESRARTPGVRNRYHSGQGHTAENVIVFIICMAALCAGFFFFGTWGMWDLALEPWMFSLGLALSTISFMLPLWFLRSKTARRAQHGKELTLDS